MKVRPLRAEDWEVVRRIFLEGIATGDATFETEAPDWTRWDQSHAASCRLVAETDGSVVGWAALSPVSTRRVYRGVGEVSVYVAEAARGNGIGEQLLKALIEESERNEFWTLQASVFPENVASITVHERCGFTIVGQRKRIGCLNGIWRDSVLLERRSRVIGL